MINLMLIVLFNLEMNLLTFFNLFLNICLSDKIILVFIVWILIDFWLIAIGKFECLKIIIWSIRIHKLFMRYLLFLLNGLWWFKRKFTSFSLQALFLSINISYELILMWKFTTSFIVMGWPVTIPVATFIDTVSLCFYRLIWSLILTAFLFLRRCFIINSTVIVISMVTSITRCRKRIKVSWRTGRPAIVLYLPAFYLFWYIGFFW